MVVSRVRAVASSELRATPRRLATALRKVLRRHRRDLSDPRFLRTLPAGRLTRIATVDEGGAVYVLCRAPGDMRKALTDPEIQVARLVAEGLSNKLIAQRLYRSPDTIAWHIRAIYAKLSIDSRVELAKLALGLLVE